MSSDMDKESPKNNISEEQGAQPTSAEEPDDRGAGLGDAVPGSAVPGGKKKEFKFIRPIDELYDESNSEAEPNAPQSGQEGGEPAPEESYAPAGAEAEASDTSNTSDTYKRPEPEIPEIPAQPQAQGESDEESSREQDQNRKKGCMISLISTVIICAVICVTAVFLISAFLDYTALNHQDKKINVDIPKNSSITSIANELKTTGVINNAIAFRIYAKVKHISGLQYGTYTLNSDMNYDDIVESLRKSAAKRETVKVTIPEGKTAQWIENKLVESGVCDKNEFLTVCEKGGCKFSLESQIQNSDGRLYKYEGYLFPDTYYFYKGWTAKAAAQKLLDGFNAKFDDKLRARAKELGMSVDQTVILASVIQAETGNVKQMSHVSSVFHNRLKNGVAAAGGKKLLQSDATIYYITKQNKAVLQQDSTKIESPYNTYLHEGLPPGAICNPGLDAIRAALYPDSTNDYYFVTDSTGNYYYASTYSEHSANVRKAMRTDSAGGTDVYK